MKLTNIGWVMVILAILRLMGYIHLAWWIILLPLEIQAVCFLLGLALRYFETPTERRCREARELCGQIIKKYSK